MATGQYGFFGKVEKTLCLCGLTKFVDVRSNPPKYISERGKRIIMNHFHSWLIFILCLFILSLTPEFNITTSSCMSDRARLEFNSGNQAFASEFIFTSSVGYNSNPALEPKDGGQDPKGSPFSINTLSVEHGFTIGEKFSIDILSSATYQHLWELPDNNQFNIGISVSSFSARNRFVPYLFANERLYRDAMLKQDERDEFSLGAGGEILLSGRYTLSFEHTWQFINYLEDATLFFRAGRGLQMNIGNENINSNPNRLLNNLSLSEMPMNNALNQVYSARDDINMALKTCLDIFLLPSLTASVSLKYEYLVSSLDAESFLQLTPGVKIAWNFANQWQFIVDTQLERREYSDLSIIADSSEKSNLLNVRDINYTTSINFRLAYFGNSIEYFTNFFMKHVEYPLNNESYNQQVVECGFSWPF